MYGPVAFAVHEHGDSNAKLVKVDYGNGLEAEIGDFTFGNKAFGFKYITLPPALSQNVDCKGTTIRIDMEDTSSGCKLKCSYNFPAQLPYPAHVHFAGLTHELLDFVMLALGEEECNALNISPMAVCNHAFGAAFQPLRRERRRSGVSDPDYETVGPSG